MGISVPRNVFSCSRIPPTAFTPYVRIPLIASIHESNQARIFFLNRTQRISLFLSPQKLVRSSANRTRCTCSRKQFEFGSCHRSICISVLRSSRHFLAWCTGAQDTARRNTRVVAPLRRFVLSNYFCTTAFSFARRASRKLHAWVLPFPRAHHGSSNTETRNTSEYESDYALFARNHGEKLRMHRCGAGEIGLSRNLNTFSPL